MSKIVYFLSGVLLIASMFFSGCDAKTEQVDAPGGVERAENSVTQNYNNGVYEDVGSYLNPSGNDSIGVKLNLENDVVKSLSISIQANDKTSKKFQKLFSEGIEELVVGKKIQDIKEFDSVNGASFTPVGFQRAIEAIKSQAAI